MANSKQKRRQSMAPSTARGSSAKQSKSSSDDYNKKNLLDELSRKAGLILKNGQVPNELNVSKAVFQKQLGQALKNHVGGLLENVENFLEDLSEYVEEPDRFHKSLMPCDVTADNENIQSSVPDSTLRLLLGVDVIQSPLMTLLLEKLQEFQGDEDDFTFHQGQRVYIPRLLLSQFRFLDRIVDGKELSKKLLEILSTTSLDVQKEIMACIPDIVEDSEHGEVARKLRDELRNNTDLTCPVIDALTYLNISTDLLSEVRNTVLEMLKSFSIQDLPIVINFLLESVTSQEALEVVNEIRSSIDFTTSSRLSAEEQEKIKTNIKLTIDALKGRMQFQRFVADAWIKALDAAKDSKELDIFVLLMLHWMNNKKAVESLMRNKIRAGLVTETLLSKVFSSYAQVVRDYFPSILALAQALLRSPEPTICLVGCTMYKQAFTSFDSYCQQEIVGNLITHIGSGFSSQVEASLDILSDLVKTQLPAMSRFAVFIKGVLDYLDHNNLTVAQIRKLYLLLAQLAFHSAQDGSYLQDDLHIIIRKQLTSGNSRYKRMGVMGAISLIHAVAANDGSGDILASEEYKQVVDLLELVQNCGRRDPETAALFMDSLAAMMGTERLYKNVEVWVADNMTQVFEESYVADLEEDANLKQDSLVSIDGLYGLNNEAESTIVINLVPLVEKMLDKATVLKEKSTDNSPLCLSPLFHLVTVSELRQADGDLENIDALLGCPVFMPTADVYSKLETLTQKQRDVVCASLFLCINWFREVINSFASMTNPEMKAKVMMRLKHITELTSTLKQCLAAHNNFQPPPAIFDVEAVPLSTGGAGPSTAGQEGKKKTSKAGGGKKKKGKQNTTAGEEENTTLLDELGTQTQNSGKSQEAVVIVNKETTIDLSNYRRYFRELDINVFTILNTGLITKAALDSEMNTKVTEELQIGLSELEFILEDLSLKLSHALIASASKRRTFFKNRGEKNVGFSALDHYSPSQIAKKAVCLLPCLCDHLEEACTFFQTQISGNDGLIDGPGRFSQDSVIMASCYHLLLQCILSLLSWNGFGSEENKPLLKDALKVMVNRMRVTQDQSSFVSQQDAVKSSFQYFGNLVETCPNLDTAVTLLKLLVVLVEKHSDTSMKEKLSDHAKIFLNRDWQGPDGERIKGAKHNENLQVVIKIYLEYSAEPLDVLNTMASDGLAELVQQDKNGCAEEFVSLNRLTYPIFYKAVLAELITNIKRIPSGKKNESEDVREDKLNSWTKAVKVLHVTVSLTKTFTARSNLGAALKYGRQFVEIFLRQGMPLLDVTFRRHHGEVEQLLRSLQQSTRKLHHLCGHSKITKDVTLTNQVPLVKRALEAFVYRVKAMLSLNNCQDAFWVGNLKNRNLQGEEILTQNSTCNASAGDDGNDDDGDGNDEDVGADDDDDSEVEMGEETRQEDSNADGGSYSEVF